MNVGGSCAEKLPVGGDVRWWDDSERRHADVMIEVRYAVSPEASQRPRHDETMSSEAGEFWW